MAIKELVARRERQSNMDPVLDATAAAIVGLDMRGWSSTRASMSSSIRKCAAT